MTSSLVSTGRGKSAFAFLRIKMVIVAQNIPLLGADAFFAKKD